MKKLDVVKAQSRMSALKAALNHHNHQYYVLDSPEIPDVEWDRLYKELETLEHEWPDLVGTDSPTQRVGGYAASKFGSVHHSPPMLSLNKVHSEAELQHWVDGITTLLH